MNIPGSSVGLASTSLQWFRMPQARVGTIGMVLAAPPTCAALPISRELAAANAEEAAADADRAPPGTDPEVASAGI